MTRFLLVFVCFLLFVGVTANCQMVSNSAIQNDSAKETLCAQRAKVKPVPFLIDQNYVQSIRAKYPDTTFIAEDGVIPELIECRVSESTGKYEADSTVSEQSYWHLPRPQQFTPGIHTAGGEIQATDACLKAARDKVNRQGFDHSYSSGLGATEINLSVGPWYRPGVTIAGMKAERYDIGVEGKLFYKSSGLDLDVFRVSCLLSPTLDVKAVQASEENTRRELKMESRFEEPFRK
jgi:hypothetical protein